MLKFCMWFTLEVSTSLLKSRSPRQNLHAFCVQLQKYVSDRLKIWCVRCPQGVVRHYRKVGHHIKIQYGCHEFCQNDACAICDQEW
jgi:hypothetical protein